MSSSKEFREKDTSHLEHELAQKQKHLFDLRSQGVTEKLEDPSQLHKTRKEIARIKTILRQRQLEQAAQAETTQAETAQAETAQAETAQA